MKPSTVFLTRITVYLFIIDLTETCPQQSCSCFSDSDYPGLSSVECFVPALNRQLGEQIQTRLPVNTRSISFVCYKHERHYDFFSVDIFNRSGENLIQLEIENCFISGLTQTFFSGIPNLTSITIKKSGHIQFDAGILSKYEHSLTSLWISDSAPTNIDNKELCDLSSLMSLVCVNCSLDSLASIGLDCDRPLPNLTLIKLDQNSIRHISSNFGSILRNLKRLSFSKNAIQIIEPNALNAMEDMEELDLSWNKISHIPEDAFTRMTGLQTINISNNNFQHLPASLCTSARLNHLSLNTNPLGNAVSDSLQNCSSLRFLNLANTDIEQVRSDWISTMRNLTTLNLSRNNINLVGPFLFEGQQYLEVLDLSINNIDHLETDSFAGLYDLHFLNLSYNRLTEIAAGLFGSMNDSIERLDLSDNNLSSIMVNGVTLKHLAYINLNNNNITVLNKTMMNQFMPMLEEFFVSGNQIQNLQYRLFKGLSRLTMIDLSFNNIVSINDNAFTDIDSLRHLNLAHNLLLDVMYTFRNIPKLSFLLLQNNRIETTLVSGIFPENLLQLNLAHNNISLTVMTSFVHLRFIQSVNLTYNRITRIFQFFVRQPCGFTPSILLANNPLDCGCRVAWLIPYVHGNTVTSSCNYFIFKDAREFTCDKPVRLHKHKLETISYDDFVCYYDSSIGYCLGISCSCCFRLNCSCRFFCPKMCSCSYRFSWNRQDVNCTDRRLTMVPSEIAIDTTLIYLDGNNISTISNSSFGHEHRRAHAIFLNNSNIATISPLAFSMTAVLRILHLQYNSLEVLDSGIFSGLGALEQLYLQGNHIRYIASDAFIPLTHLVSLALQENSLVHIDFSILANLPGTQLMLSHNPWTCNCTFIDSFQNFMTAHASQIVDSQQLVCFMEDYQRSQIQDLIHLGKVDTSLIEDFIPLYTFLTDKTILCSNIHIHTVNTTMEWLDSIQNKIGLAVLLALIVTIVLASVLLYKWRLEIQIWLFTRFGVRLINAKELDENKQYDAFISYSSHDEEFIVHTLAPSLENGNPAYKLCLHYRDFPVGAPIAQTIICSVEESSRTILVISDHFLSSEWCRLELQAAHEQLLKDRTKRVIVILLHDISPSVLPPQLRAYISTNTYLRADDPWFWSKLRYALPKKATGKRNPPCKRPNHDCFRWFAKTDRYNECTLLTERQVTEEITHE